MNQIWGDMTQYQNLAWHWPIAVYLFLAGLSAGSIITSMLVKWLIMNKTKDDTKIIFWDAVVEAGAIIAPITISIGLLLLIVDLGKPFSFYILLLEYNLTSVMSWGVIALLIYSPLAYVYCFLVFSEKIKNIPILSMFYPILNILHKYTYMAKSLEYILASVALVIAAYTGFLLAVNLSFPLWNTPILPILFTVSAISSGVASSIIVALLFFKQDIDKDIIKYLLILDLRLITVEVPLIVMLFVGIALSGGNGIALVKDILSDELWFLVLFVGVIGIGLLGPVIIAFTALKNHSYRVGYILLNASLVLFGVFVLRLYIVYAGQIFSW